jgi:hypothetical protein
MLTIGAAVTRMRALQDLLTPTVCLNPTMLRTQLLNLDTELTSTAGTLAMLEMNLVQNADVRLERFLLPFLQNAEAFFRFANRRIPELRAMVQMALRLLGTQAPTSFSVYQCRDAGRIRINLRLIDQRLGTLNEVLRQMEAAYAADAQRIYQVIQRQINAPPLPPPEPGAIIAPMRPRATSIAEQTAIAAVRMFRQQADAHLTLVRAALQEVVQALVTRVPGAVGALRTRP